MVAAGLGITIIPYTAIAGDLRLKRFAYARIRGHRLHREIGWVRLRSEYVPRSVTEMLAVFDEMKDRFAIKPPGV
jgi:DNA-binding transcriptional LysR family regulator